MKILIFLALVIFSLGGVGILQSKNIVKTIIFLSVVQTSLILVFVFAGTKLGSGIPILDIEKVKMVDPLPQALIITAIVIGASTTALALMMSVKIFHYYGTLEWKRIFERAD